MVAPTVLCAASRRQNVKQVQHPKFQQGKMTAMMTVAFSMVRKPKFHGFLFMIWMRRSKNFTMAILLEKVTTNKGGCRVFNAERSRLCRLCWIIF